jgi:hypothetical protein
VCFSVTESGGPTGELLAVFKIAEGELKVFEFSTLLVDLFVLFSLDLRLVGITLDERGMLLLVVVFIHDVFDFIFFGLWFFRELSCSIFWWFWSFLFNHWCGFRLTIFLSGINGRVDCGKRITIISLMLQAVEFHCTRDT